MLDKYKQFVTVQSTGLAIKAGLPIEQWLEVGEQLKRVETGIQWWIGDWLNYGESEYGEKYSQALDATDYTYQGLSDIAYVCKNYEISRRRDNVSFSAHRELLSLDKNAQDEALEQEQLTVQHARQIARENKHLLSSEQTIRVEPVEYGENIYFNSGESSEVRWDDHIIKEDKYPTLTRLSRFFHANGKEFSLREYADVQEFPKTYKLVGNYSSIKSQLGNAVSPTMAQFVGNKLKGKTFIDLFAGCGGLSCGLELIGKKAIYANEREPSYFTTYIANHPDTQVSIQDIRNVDAKDIPNADIVVGGPPCQGFSNAGLRIKDDPRNEMYKEFLRIVEAKSPKEFLIENVPEIASIKDQIIKDFEDINYSVTFELIHGPGIGMKQTRTRAFFIGNKNE